MSTEVAIPTRRLSLCWPERGAERHAVSAVGYVARAQSGARTSALRSGVPSGWCRATSLARARDLRSANKAHTAPAVARRSSSCSRKRLDPAQELRENADYMWSLV